ncbi:MAG: hypothetical protein A2309_05070 [Bacteroidetes bacterium RIFOXYB2_FULL_35_7]|nr:MAG: hypothetical protein A2X01_08165 [Bacteroidetes bacterium GWF2_35_48]OFY93986.1 MAG: hypothetical protein A2491_03560 [Bacteroidetes bacterium RIFOXYC12_FULL_35_7]OFY94119.1 MAG: hypothetical protein A2309_05070 [Bacteroidetes bacterium RIFOXYB2_FULL_35_7]HBX51133.1 toxin-antitoxin system YwqK family antitoxin [Bacteroidales bacterium]
MKKLFVIVLLCSLISFSFAQNIQEKDGKYYKEGKEYSGIFEKNEEGTFLKMNIVNGLLDGITMLYFDNKKQKEQRSYKEGKFDGLWITWNDQGKKMAEANYKEGKKHGKWLVWDDKGTLRYEMYYEEGVRKGKWIMWDESGKLISEQVY